jgi:hypothetical protein
MIEVQIIYTFITGQFVDSNGKYFLDVDPEQLRLTEKVNNFLADKLEIPSAIGLTLKRTPRNRRALEPFINGQSGEYAGKACKVVAYLGDMTLPFTDLFVVSSDEQTYTAELKLGNSYWLIKAEMLKLNAIPFDIFSFTAANIASTNNVGAYVDGGSPIRLPHVNWGQLTNNPNNINLVQNSLWTHDMRPFVSLLYLLRKGFAACGMAFTSTLLESDFGRRLIMYLLREDYGNVQNNNARRSLEVVSTTESTLMMMEYNDNKKIILPFSHIYSDPGHNYTGGSPEVFANIFQNKYFYRSPGFIGTIRIKAKFELRTRYAVNGGVKLRIMMINNLYSNLPLIIKEVDMPVVYNTLYQPLIVTVICEIENATIPPLSILYVESEQYADDTIHVKLLAQNTFSIIPERSLYSEGDTINMADELDPNLSFLDVLKGVVHLFDAKLYYKRNSGHIYLFPTLTSNLFDDSEIEGFYKDTFIDITEQVVPNSLKRNFEKTVLSENTRVGFASTSEKGIAIDIPGKDYQIFDGFKTINPGGYSQEIISRNPLFRATLNKEITFINNLTDPDTSLRRAPHDLPYISDNENGEYSFNVGFRVLYFAGNKAVRRKMTNGDLVIPGLVYNDNDVTAWYTFNLANLVNTDGTKIKECLIYGNRKGDLKDLYKMFWLPSLQLIQDSVKHNILVYDVGDIDFRDIINVDIEGHSYPMRLIEIQDWDGGVSGISTPLTLVPTKGNLTGQNDYDTPLEPRSTCDYGDLHLTATIDSGCWTAEVVGTSPLTITDIDYSYKYDVDLSFTPGDTLCNPTGNFTFQATVTFDGDCAPLTFTYYIVPCQNNPQLVLDFNPVTGCLTITVDNSQVNSTIDTSVITYSIDGGAWLTYSTPLCSLSGVNLIEVNLVQSYVGGCVDMIRDGQIEFPITQFDCSLNTPELSYNEISDCKIIPYRIGDVIQEIVIYDHIYYRHSASSEWQLWDENTPLDTPIFLKRVVEYAACETDIFYINI